MILVIVFLVSLIPLVPTVTYFLGKRKQNLSIGAKRVIAGFNGFNVILGCMAVLAFHGHGCQRPASCNHGNI